MVMVRISGGGAGGLMGIIEFSAKSFSHKTAKSDGSDITKFQVILLSKLWKSSI